MRTLHPDAIEANRARLFILRGGEELTGIAITALRSPTIKVSGQVFSSIALPVQTNARGLTRTMPVQLTLIPLGKNTAEDPNNRTTLSVSLDSPTDGKFELPGVIPGSYDLYARAINNSTADQATITAGTTPAAYFGRTSFEAGPQDVSGLAVHIRPGVEVKTYVTVDGSAAAAANTVRVSLQLDDSTRSLPAYVGRGGQLQAGADGIITFPFVNEGVYRLQPAILAANAVARRQRGAGQPLRNAYVEDITAFIAKYEARGTSISVNASSTTNTQITVIPADR